MTMREWITGRGRRGLLLPLSLPGMLCIGCFILPALLVLTIIGPGPDNERPPDPWRKAQRMRAARRKDVRP
jgi:hypothetical protein